MTKINGFEIASGFSVGGSGSNVASDIIFSPPEGMTSTNLQDAIIEAASMGGGSQSFTPTKKITISATCSGLGGFRLMPAQISTAYAKGNGSDIRIQVSDGNGNPTGDFLPIVVRSMGDSDGVFNYSIAWSDTIGTGATKDYIVTYGDSAAEFMVMTQDQLSPIIALLNSNSTSVVYYDKSMAYVPPVEDWGVVGTQVLGAADDSALSFTPIVSPYLWNKISCTTTIGMDTNGAFSFGNPPTLSAAHGGFSPDSLGWLTNDLYQTWVRQVALPDGFYIQWDGKTYGSNLPIKVTLRYVIDGRWILTWFDSTGITPPKNMVAYIGTQIFTITLTTLPTRSDPTSYGVIVVDSNIISSVIVGPEENI
jgi:hypothetical protein